MSIRKLNIGCGHDIKPGWINHDLAKLPGVEVVHNLKEFPWPWEDSSIDEVFMKDVLEHLPDTIMAMNELYRITRPGAKIYIAVPYWNSFEAITDPTHLSKFNEYTFEFFDPGKKRCLNRPYYSKARFEIEKLGFGIAPFKPYFLVPRISSYKVFYSRPIKKILQILASHFSNIIIGLEVHLKKTV